MKKMIRLIVMGLLLLPHYECLTDNKPKTDIPMIIDELYKNISGFTITEKERTDVRDKGGNPTYGEITYKGADELLRTLDLKPTDVFYDLGSGVGKLVVQAILTTPIKKAVGVELSPTRHEHAVSIKKELATRDLLKDKELEFVNQNVSQAALSDATVIFMCSTCFSDELMKSLTDKFSKLKKGVRVITLRKLPEPNKFKLIKQLHLPMSWSNSSIVYIYQLDDSK